MQSVNRSARGCVAKNSHWRDKHEVRTLASSAAPAEAALETSPAYQSVVLRWFGAH